MELAFVLTNMSTPKKSKASRSLMRIDVDVAMAVALSNALAHALEGEEFPHPDAGLEPGQLERLGLLRHALMAFAWNEYRPPEESATH